MAVADNLLSRRRIAMMLLLAYGGLFLKMYSGGSAPEMTNAAREVNGVHLLDGSMIEPLTRASVLASSASTQRDKSKNVKMGKVGMRRETAKREAQETLASAQETERGPEGALEEVLKRTAANPDPQARAELTATIHASLGNMHSARADYAKAVHAMDLGVQAAEETVGEALANFAHLELRHQRYSSAEARFGDVLLHKDSLSMETLVSSTCGLGWALLMQGQLGLAGTHFGTALQHSGHADDACAAHFDGLDAQRVAALAGLSIAEEADRAKRVNCADRILRGKAADLQEPWPRQALGLAYLGLGNTRAARGHHARAVQLEGQRAGSEVDLVAGARGLLCLGLAKFADTGNISMAAAQVSHVRALKPEGAQAAEMGELLARFASSHSTSLVGRIARAQVVALFLASAAEAFEKSGDEARLRLHRAQSAEFLLGIQTDLAMSHAVHEGGPAVSPGTVFVANPHEL